MSTMYLSDPPYALWSIWNQLSLSQHAFVFALGALCTYAAFVSFSVVKGLRRIRNYDAEQENTDERRLNALRNRCINLRRTTEAGFCLFGVVLFLHLQTVGVIVMGSAVETQILGSFRLHCAFATNVIVVFFVLHMIQWIVAGRITTCSERLSKRDSRTELS
jgi:hypothetical protein